MIDLHGGESPKWNEEDIRTIVIERCLLEQGEKAINIRPACSLHISISELRPLHVEVTMPSNMNWHQSQPWNQRVRGSGKCYLIRVATRGRD